MQQLINKAARSWEEENMEYNYEARGDVKEAAAYIKNTSDLYLEYTNRMKDYKDHLDKQ